MRPVVRVGQRQVLGLDRRDRGRGVGCRHLLQAAAGRVAAREVEVHLQRTAGPAGLRLADRLAGRQAAVRGLRLREQPELHQRQARVDREELRAEAVVGRDERVDVVRVVVFVIVAVVPAAVAVVAVTVLVLVVAAAHQLARPREHVVRLVVGGGDERVALCDAVVLDAVQVDVVERGVRRAVRQLRRDEAQELVRELVRRRHAGHQEVRLVGLDDVVEHRQVPGLPVQALLHVRLLGDDARLEHREVRGLRGRELLREELREVAGEAGLAGPRRPRCERARDGGVEEPDARQVRGQLLDLDEHAGGEPGGRPADDLHLDVGELAFAQDRRPCRQRSSSVRRAPCRSSCGGRSCCRRSTR